MSFKKWVHAVQFDRGEPARAAVRKSCRISFHTGMQHVFIWARLPVSISAWYCSPRLKIVRVSGGAVGGAAPLPFLPICATR